MEVIELQVLGQTAYYLQEFSHCVQIYFPIVMYSDGVCCCLHVTYNTRVDNGPHQSLGLCEVSHTYMYGI